MTNEPELWPDKPSSMDEMAWSHDRDEVITFGRILIEMGHMTTAEDALAYIEKAGWQFTAAHAIWEAAGRPSPGNPHWTPFVTEHGAGTTDQP